MTNLEFLTDIQAEVLTGGTDAGWGFPALLSEKASSMGITNLISQSNVGSAWGSSTAIPSSSGFGGFGGFRMKPQGGGATISDATNIQKNILKLNNFGFSLTV
jgi:hypothetical protein